MNPEILAEIECTPLQKAVLLQLGYEELNEEAYGHLANVQACSAGGNGGFPGFVSYNENCEFYIRNSGLILEDLEEYSDNVDISVIEVVRGFNILTDKDNNPIWSSNEVAKCIYDAQYEGDGSVSVRNALAISMLERVACDITESYYEAEQERDSDCGM